jgi:hypothetical protein
MQDDAMSCKTYHLPSLVINYIQSNAARFSSELFLSIGDLDFSKEVSSLESTDDKCRPLTSRINCPERSTTHGAGNATQLAAHVTHRLRFSLFISQYGHIVLLKEWF